MAKHKPETVVKASMQIITRLERENRELRGIIESATLRLDGLMKVKLTDPNIILDQVHGALETLRSI